MTGAELTGGSINLTIVATIILVILTIIGLLTRKLVHRRSLAPALAIIGPAGVGKTAFLSNLLYDTPVTTVTSTRATIRSISLGGNPLTVADVPGAPAVTKAVLSSRNYTHLLVLAGEAPADTVARAILLGRATCTTCRGVAVVAPAAARKEIAEQLFRREGQTVPDEHVVRAAADFFTFKWIEPSNDREVFLKVRKMFAI